MFRLKNEAVSCWLVGVGLSKVKLTETDNPDLNLTGKIAPRERQSTSLSPTERQTDRQKVMGSGQRASLGDKWSFECGET